KRVTRKSTSSSPGGSPASGSNSSLGNVSNVSVGKRKKENVTNVDAAPTRRAGFAVPAARKQSLNEANDKKLILPKYDAFSVPDLKKKIKCMEITVKDMSVQISTNEKEITRLREEHVENNRCHAMQTEEMLKEHQVEVDSLSKELRNQTLSNQELQKEYDALEQDEKFELKCKCDTLEDALKTDTKVQAAIAQLKHLPEEVESLKTVLAMKNQEVQEMRIKMVDLEKQVAEIPAKDDKIKQLQAKVEDLSAMVECKIVYERQLSSEQVTLRENFEKETNANKRLSMEKEELIWRLNQNQTGQSAISPGRFTPPKFNPSHIPSSPLTSRTLLSRASSSESHESGVFSPNNPPQQ
ncbi:hypothetical protein BSL78_18779, partial [Apostichopus japonicus]